MSEGGGGLSRTWQSVFDASYAACRLLAHLAKLCLGFIVVLIVVDVTIRNLGGRPPLWTVPVTEYLMLYITALGVPFLVRIKGHVVIAIVVSRLEGVVRRRLEQAIYAVSAVCFFFLGVIALGMTIDAAITGDFQIRAFETPTWLIYLPLPIGFFLAVVEFVRYIVIDDSIFTRPAAESDSL